jgi:hypothetical protein
VTTRLHHDRTMATVRARTRSRGQALVEFAIILPLLLLLTVGVVDAARIFSSWIALTNGVREGALYATTLNNPTHWCATSGAIACPPGPPNSVVGDADCADTAPSGPIGIQCPDPENIAYLVGLETTGLDQTRIILGAPTCGGGACDSAAATTVTVSASYQMNMIFPVIGQIFGNPLTMSAEATAPILR